MSVASIVNVTVSLATVQPSQAGFGTPLILAHHTVGAGGPLVQSYSDLSELLDAGFTVDSAVYVLASAMFSQNPRPPVVKVGRRANSNPQVTNFLPTVTTEGKVYKLTIIAGGETYTFEYTVQSGDTAADISTELKALIDAESLVGLTTSISTATLVCTAAAGKRFRFRDYSAWLTVSDATASTNLTADLAAVRAEDDDWYALVTDANSEGAIAAVAAVVETLEKVYVAATGDSEVLDSGDSDDIASTLKAANYKRTFVQYHSEIGGGAHAALLAQRLTANPGSATWAYKTLAGITADVLTTSQQSAALNKNANVYVALAGLSITRKGVMASGEYADVVRGVDWLIARIRERILSLLANNPKVPYTDPGIESIGNEIRAQLAIAAGPDHNLIVPDSAVVSLPKAASVSSGDKLARVLNNVRFSGNLQGAIHTLTVAGTLSP